MTWESASTLIFIEMDMTKIMNSWKDNPETWSNNLQALNIDTLHFSYVVYGITGVCNMNILKIIT